MSIPNTRMCISKDKVSGVNVENSGVRCQVSGKRNIEAETYWSEAAAGNTEILVIVIRYL